MRQNAILISGLIIILAILTGCGEQAGKVGAVQSETPKTYAKSNRLQGSVSNDAGPVKSGMVKALAVNGVIIAETSLVNASRYSLDIPPGTLLPLVLTYFPEDGGDKMMAVVVHTSISKYDINTLSTQIAKQAKALGGYTHNNLVRAAESMVAVPDENKTTSGFRGDPTKQYGGWH